MRATHHGKVTSVIFSPAIHPSAGKRRSGWAPPLPPTPANVRRSAIEYVPAHLIAQPLVVQHEFSDLAGKPCPLPLAL